MFEQFIEKRTNSIFDPEFTRAFKEMPLDEWFSKSPPFDCRDEYVDTFLNRIRSSKLNRAQIDGFTDVHVTNGTTQAFDESYWLYAGRRLRVFRGEYAYHRRVNPTAVFLEDGPLEPNDYVIVSLPFCSTGDVHPKMREMLDDAAWIEVPVIVDCAYWGTCWGIDFNLRHPAIEQACFSLTKSLGLGDMRSGVRLSYVGINGGRYAPIAQQHEYNHLQLFPLKIGIYMMNRFEPDYIPNKYRAAQESVCQDADITPTKCMHLGLGDDTWYDYRVDDKYNRLGIRRLVKERFAGRI